MATPYAKKIIENIIEYKNYKPSDDLIKEIIETSEYVTMPDCVGLSIYDAVDRCENVGLQVEIQGDSDIVKSQFPAPDSEVIKNGIVLIDTEN